MLVQSLTSAYRFTLAWPGPPPPPPQEIAHAMGVLSTDVNPCKDQVLQQPYLGKLLAHLKKAMQVGGGACLGGMQAGWQGECR